MRVRIHRGAAEIGGNCVEVASDDGRRIVLDVGRPISAGWSQEVALPSVPGLKGMDATLCGVLISHPHLDHYGLIGGVDPSVPVFIGAEAAGMLRAAAFFSPVGAKIEPAGFFRDREPLMPCACPISRRVPTCSVCLTIACAWMCELAGRTAASCDRAE